MLSVAQTQGQSSCRRRDGVKSGALLDNANLELLGGGFGILECHRNLRVIDFTKGKGIRKHLIITGTAHLNFGDVLESFANAHTFAKTIFAKACVV